MLLLGIFKCGTVIKFIPDPVITGFTAGIAFNMVSRQIPTFFGMCCENLPTALHEKIAILYDAAGTWDHTTTILATASLLILYLCSKPPLNKLPGPLVVLILGMIIQMHFQFDNVATIGSVYGGLPRKLPTFVPTPDLSFQTVKTLLAPAFVIAILGAIESLLCAVITDSITGIKHSSNQELIGHGLANIITPLFGGIASTGSLTRTIASIKAGGNSPLAGLSSAVFLCLILCFFAPIAKYIPLASLAAILFMLGYKMVNFKHCYNLVVHAPKSDATIMILTFLMTLFFGIVMAVNAGVILSALLLMHRLSRSSAIDRTIATSRTMYDFSHIPTGIAIYAFSGPIFFGMIDKFAKTFSAISPDDKVIIMRMFDVPFIDATGLESLNTTINALQRRGKTVLLSETNDYVMRKLRNSHIIDTQVLSTAQQPILEAIDRASKILFKESV